MQFTLLPVDSILIGDRQRTLDDATLKHIDNLAADIAQNGLIHAATLKEGSELVAGFCRLHAIMKLQKPYMYARTEVAPGFIPVVFTHLTTEAELFRLELMENLRRKNLTPMDEAKAIARLHEMLTDQHPEGWTKEGTAKHLAEAREEPKSASAGSAEVSDALLIAGFADDPDIAKASSRKEAVNLAKKKLESQFRQGLGALAQITDSDHNLILGNCLEEMKKLQAGRFSGIVVDPPYGMEAQSFGEQTRGRDHDYDDSKTNALLITDAIFSEGFRICKDDAHLYMFCTFELFPLLVAKAAASGWTPFPTPLLWHKPNVGHAPWPGYWRRSYECILFARISDSRRLSAVHADIFTHPHDTDKVHAAQKPVALLKELMSLSFFPGEEVLDPCCGSGSIFLAAKSLSLKATGIELSEASYNLAKQRITQ